MTRSAAKKLESEESDSSPTGKRSGYPVLVEKSESIFKGPFQCVCRAKDFSDGPHGPQDWNLINLTSRQRELFGDARESSLF